MITTKVDKMGRTVIPSKIRKLLNLKEGDLIEWIIENNKIVIKKYLHIDKTVIENRFNLLKQKAPKCFTEKEDEEEDKWASKEWALAKLGL
ncbi:MAG: AbrB/MazE/SpoVT family DNA-binding domain-containing protein [Candidatus Odinarchaeota archaeon]|nr:AbrB/MazE/SpoVT family DNA-binding domain-containing protein [Candidatus Odinarchaeota archaeon]